MIYRSASQTIIYACYIVNVNTLLYTLRSLLCPFLHELLLYSLATHFILVQAGCGVCGVSPAPATIFKTSQNMQHLTKKSVGAELGCCVVTLLLLGIYQEGIWLHDHKQEWRRHILTLTSQDKHFISTHHCNVLILTSDAVTDQCQCQNVLKASFIPASVCSQAVASVQWWAM